MAIDDVIEILVREDWSRRWVRLRGLLVAGLVLLFPSAFVALVNWYAHWKATGFVHDVQPVLVHPTP